MDQLVKPHTQARNAARLLLADRLQVVEQYAFQGVDLLHQGFGLHGLGDASGQLGYLGRVATQGPQALLIGRRDG